MIYKASVKEIFTSIQGEGPYVGVKQLFIRFCGCNLCCDYCDTDSFENQETFEFTPIELREHLENFDIKTIHSISLTGGEPLLWPAFLNEFLPLVNNKIYLETNSTLNKNLESVINYIDIISADIKLPSTSGIENSFAEHDEFFKMARKYDKEIFAKVVFDENILNDEINNCLKLVEKYNLMLILQPRMSGNIMPISKGKMFEVFNKFLLGHANTRLIPQVHKFMQIL